MKPSQQRLLLFQQRIEQMKAAREEYEKQEQLIDSHINEYQNCLVQYGGEDVISVFSDHEKCMTMKRKIEEASPIIQTLEKYIPTNFKFDQTVEELSQVIEAIKKLQERRELLQKSIDELSIMSKDLINDRDTYGDELQNARTWAREIETEQANSSKELIKQLKETQKNIREQKANSNKNLQDHDDKYRSELNELYDLDIFNDHYRRALPGAIKDLETAKNSPHPTDDQAQQLLQYIKYWTDLLDDKLVIVREMMTGRFNVQQLRLQNEEIHKHYKIIKDRFNQLKSDTEDLIKNVKESISTNNGYQQQIAKKEELNNKLNSELEEIDKEIESKTVQLEEEKVRSQEKEKELKFLESQVNINDEQGAQMRKLQERKKAINKIQEESTKVKQIDDLNTKLQQLTSQYKTHSTAVDAKANTVREFKEILNMSIGIFREFSDSEGNSQIAAEQRSLDEILKQFKEPKVRGIGQFRSVDYENPEFQKFMPQDSIVIPRPNQDKDQKQYILDYSTEEAFYNSLFDARNKEYDYISLHIFMWHNLLMKPLTAAYNLDDCRVKLKQNSRLVDSENPDDFVQVDASDGFETLKEYIFRWIELFPDDFKQEKVKQIVVEKIIRDINISTEAFEQRLNDALTHQPTKINEPKVMSDNKALKEMKKKKIKNSADLVINFPPKILAEHFTYVELETFNRIGYYEFTKTAWSRQGKEQLAPNLVKFTKRFNDMADFIAYTIVCPDVKKRKEVLERWIDIMDEASKLKNFNLIFEIDGALNKPAITRLESLWGKISKEHQERYNELTKLTSPFKKFGKYKEKLRSSNHKVALPYPGPWLTDMTFVQDGNQTSKTSDNGQIQYNLSKHRYYYPCVTFLKNDWGSNYSFEIDKELKDMVVKLEILPQCELNDNRLYKLSEKIK